MLRRGSLQGWGQGRDCVSRIFQKGRVRAGGDNPGAEDGSRRVKPQHQDGQREATTKIPPVTRHRSTYTTVLGRVGTGARRGAPGPVSRPPVMPRQVGLDPTGEGHSPGSHTPSPTSQDGAARQGWGTAPRAQGLASIWPSPSEHIRGLATGGQKSNELPTGSACPGPGHPLTLPRRPRQLGLLSCGPHCVQFSRLPAPEPKEDFQRDLSMGLRSNILSAGTAVRGLALKGHKGVGSMTPWKWPRPE